MIYANNIRIPQVVMIPATGLASPASAELSLVSTIDKTEAYTTATLAIQQGDYFPTTLTLPSIADGEYEYTMKQDGKVVSRGIIRIGEWERTARQGESETLHFRQ